MPLEKKSLLRSRLLGCLCPFAFVVVVPAQYHHHQCTYRIPPPTPHVFFFFLLLLLLCNRAPRTNGGRSGHSPLKFVPLRRRRQRRSRLRRGRRPQELARPHECRKKKDATTHTLTVLRNYYIYTTLQRTTTTTSTSKHFPRTQNSLTQSVSHKSERRTLTSRRERDERGGKIFPCPAET